MPPSDPRPSQSCPFLGLQDDREMRFGYPHPANACYRLRQARPLKPETQEFYCMGPGYTGCPVYIQAIQSEDWDGFQPQRAGDRVLTPVSRRRLSRLTEVLALLAALAGLGLLAIGLFGLPDRLTSPGPPAAAQIDPFEALLTPAPGATSTRRPAEPEALAALADLAATDEAGTAAALPGGPAAPATPLAPVTEPAGAGGLTVSGAARPTAAAPATAGAIATQEAGGPSGSISLRLNLPLLLSGSILAAAPPAAAPEPLVLASDPERDRSEQGAEREEPLCGPPAGWQVYTVRRGDSLSSLARATGASLAQLQSANCLNDPDQIYSGQRLWLPRPPAFPPTQVPATAVPSSTSQPTAAPATSTSAPPTAVPPSSTPLPPSATLPPPTATPPLPSATPAPPTEAPTVSPPTQAPSAMPTGVPPTEPTP